MNNKKKMVLGAAFIVAVIALAGIGYAASAGTYTGTTQSAASTYDVDYVKVSLDTTNGYTAVTPATIHLTYNSVTANTGVTTYTWSGSDYIQHDVTITIPDTETAGDPDNFSLAITYTAVANFTLQYTTTPADDNSWQTLESGGNAGITTFDAGDNDTTLYLRLKPTSNTQTTDPVASVELPVLTYTVTATQHGA